MFSNPYLRPFLVSFGLAGGVLGRSFQKDGDWTNQHLIPLLLTLGIAMVIATMLVGTFSRRSQQPWTWRKVAVITFGCWMGVFLVMGILVSVQARLNHP